MAKEIQRFMKEYISLKPIRNAINDKWKITFIIVYQNADEAKVSKDKVVKKKEIHMPSRKLKKKNKLIKLKNKSHENEIILEKKPSDPFESIQKNQSKLQKLKESIKKIKYKFFEILIKI